MKKNKITPMQKAREIEGRNRTLGTAFVLHCDGVKTEKYQKSCGSKIIVPMGVLANFDLLNKLMVDSDWRVNVGKFKNDGSEFPLTFVQCTDCWIDFYRHFISEGNKDSEEFFKKVDPTGKFHLRLNKSLESEIENKENSLIETVKTATEQTDVKNCEEGLTTPVE